jgi:hypothetical protein
MTNSNRLFTTLCHRGIVVVSSGEKKSENKIFIIHHLSDKMSDIPDCNIYLNVRVVL